MNNSPRQILCEVISDRSLLDDLQRCKNKLKELCIKQPKLEVNLLVLALEEKVPEKLLNEKKSNTPSNVVLPQLTHQLVANKGLSEPNAQWAVESWALALQVISNNECQTPSLLTCGKTGSGNAGPSSAPISGNPVSPISSSPSSFITEKKTSLALLLFILILVFAGAIGGLLYFLPHKEREAIEKQPTPNPVPPSPTSVERSEPTSQPSVPNPVPPSPVSGSTPPLPKPTSTPSLLPCNTALFGDCQ